MVNANAAAYTVRHEAGIQYVYVDSPLFATREEAVAEAAKFPKACNVKVIVAGQHNGDEYVTMFQASASVSLAPTKGNPTNEGGIKRVRKILATVPYEVVKGDLTGIL